MSTPESTFLVLSSTPLEQPPSDDALGFPLSTSHHVPSTSYDGETEDIEHGDRGRTSGSEEHLGLEAQRRTSDKAVESDADTARERGEPPTRGKEPEKDQNPTLWHPEREPEAVSVVQPTVLPPSPPLTRVPSTESAVLARPDPTEESIAGTSAAHTGLSHALEATDDTRVNEVARPSIVVRPHWLASEEAVPDASEALKSEMSPTLSHPLQEPDRNMQRSPPVWETVDPPPDNNSGRSNYPADVNGGGTQRSLAPKSSYYFGPPPADSAYGTEPQGQIGVHHPREVLRIERDWSVGDIPQFTSSYPLELEGRITPTEYLESVNVINEVLISAYSIKYAALDNALAVCTLYLSRLIVTSHYEKEMKRLRSAISELNSRVYNPVGLNILWPRSTAFMFLEVEYY